MMAESSAEVAPAKPQSGLTGEDPKRAAWFLPALAVLSLVAMAMIWIATPWGVRVGFDSYFYLNAAENLALGRGLVVLSGSGKLAPLTHFPPFYPALLAGLSLISGMKVPDAARALAVLVFGLNLFLAGYLCFRYTRSTVAGLLGAAFFLLSPILLDVVVSAFSEGIYLSCLMLGLWFIAEMAERLEARWLVLAGLTSGLGCLTRYAGAALVAAGLVAVLILNQSTIRKRIASAAGFALIALSPLVLWYARNWLLANSTSNRVFAVHWPGTQDFLLGIRTIANWFLPEALPLIARLPILAIFSLLVAGLVLWWCRRLRSMQRRLAEDAAFRFVLVSLFFAVLYLLQLFLSRSFLDASTKWNDRILSPLYLSAFLASIIAIWNAADVSRMAAGKVLAAGLVIGLLLFYLPQSLRFLRQSFQQGSGFTGSAWMHSPTLAWLRAFPEGGVVYSNNPTAIYFVLGRSAISIPERYDGVKEMVRPDYAENLGQMRTDLKKPGSLLVIFKPYQQAREWPSLAELTQGLVILTQFKDGTIYIDPSQAGT